MSSRLPRRNRWIKMCLAVRSPAINSRDSFPGLSARPAGLLEAPGACFFFGAHQTFSNFRPDLKGGYPPNLSILISGGKENNCDSLSNGE